MAPQSSIPDPEQAFLQPYSCPKGLLPRKGLSKAGAEVWAAVLRDVVESRAKGLVPHFNGPLHDVITFPDTGRALEEAARNAESEGRQLTWPEAQTIRQRARIGSNPPPGFDIPRPPEGFDPTEWVPKTPWPPRREIIVERIQQRLTAALPMAVGCYPDIFELTRYDVCPGSVTGIIGFCFGATPGQVLFEIATDQVIQLEIISWTDTRIDAAPAVGLTGLRPHNGRVWVVTAAGDASNDIVLRFHPMRVLRVAETSFTVTAGALGYPPPWGADPLANLKPFLNGRVLNDADFTIEFAEVHHEGAGHGEARAPHASGQSLAQGWHLGLEAFDQGTMRFLYRCVGPRGIPAPFFAELGPWVVFGEVGC